ncbi:MAG: hypothetical protein WDO16_20875 [Bacteroidota bacterium]
MEQLLNHIKSYSPLSAEAQYALHDCFETGGTFKKRIPAHGRKDMQAIILFYSRVR